MKRSVIITILFMLALSACNKNKPAEEPVAPSPASMSAPAPMSAPTSGTTMMPGTALPLGHPSTMASPVPTMALPSSTQSYEQTQKGIVVSFVDIPQFTYIEVSQNGKTRWLAAKTVAVKKGDVIKFDNGSTMDNFNSKSLNRTFASITFVNRVSISN